MWPSSWMETGGGPRIKHFTVFGDIRRERNPSGKIVTLSRELGIQWLTLYAFSEENWKRPAHEVTALMKLLKTFSEG